MACCTAYVVGHVQLAQPLHSVFRPAHVQHDALQVFLSFPMAMFRALFCSTHVHQPEVATICACMRTSRDRLFTYDMSRHVAPARSRRRAIQPESVIPEYG